MLASLTEVAKGEVHRLRRTTIGRKKLIFRPQHNKCNSIIFFILSLVFMVDLSVALTSSSIRPSHGSSPGRFRNDGRVEKIDKTSSPAMFLVPSQVPHIERGMKALRLNALPDLSESTISSGYVGSSNPRQKRKRRRHKKGVKIMASNQSADSSQCNKGRSSPRRTGDLPDIFWRSIPMEHLRCHPDFEALPLPETIQKLDSLEDIRLFRQESWQWDAMHNGRCTTSQAVAALGFLEPKAGKVLGVPRSWQRGGLGAYHRLCKPALRTLDELNTALCGKDALPLEDVVHSDGPFWIKPETGENGKPFPFAAKYTKRFSQADLTERKELAKHYSKSSKFDYSVRMLWGNTQEATSLLTALNYFRKQDGNVIVKEMGMCGGGLDLNQTGTENGNLLVGATPDGLICYPNGTSEVLEVKNHCPFIPLKPLPGNSKPGSSRFKIQNSFYQSDAVPPQYIPQLMMEMLCVGKECRSAVMVRQTATNGAVILRVERDDAWIDEMIYFLERFYKDFVSQKTPPPTDFFMMDVHDGEKSRYRKFLEKTQEIQENVKVVARIPHSGIQRAVANRPGLNGLFLDDF